MPGFASRAFRGDDQLYRLSRIANGQRKMLALPIQRGRSSKAKATISVMGKSQLLVWGAAISTLFWACVGNWPWTCQPLNFKTLIDSHLNRGLTKGVVKMVFCIESDYCQLFSALWFHSNSPTHNCFDKTTK